MDKDLEQRTTDIQNKLDDIIDPNGTKKELIYNVDEELIEEDPYDDKYYINDANKVEIIKYFEQLIRGSFEYRWFIDMLKKTLDVKSCVFFKGYSVDNGMKLEFHHHPFTLFDYTEAVVNKLKSETEDEFVYENDVCREVAKLHYKFVVGLVPLDPTSHEQVHDGLLEIHPDLIIGNYEKFFKEYNEFIPESTKAKYTEWLTSNHSAELEVPKNFKYKPTIINASNKFAIDNKKVEQLLLSNKLENVNNEYINKLLEGK
jgi:hypothetical protein